MPQSRRATERAFCDQGEKALLRPDIRQAYDALLGGQQPARAVDAAAGRAARERDARLKEARERIQHYDRDDAIMTPGQPISLGHPGTEAQLADERVGAGRIADAAAALKASRQARFEGAPLRALALAERAHGLAPSAGSLRTLGATHRDLGDLQQSESLLREGIRLLPGLRENTPGWVALTATLVASGALDEANAEALRLVNEDEEDPHAWRVLAIVSAARGDAPRAAEAWERSARLGLDLPGALSGLQALRKDCLARGDRAAAVGLEARIARLRAQ